MDFKKMYVTWPINWSYRKEFQDFVLEYYKNHLGFRVLDKDDPELLKVTKKIEGKKYPIRLVWEWGSDIGKGCWTIEYPKKYPEAVFEECQINERDCIRAFITEYPDCPEIQELIEKDPEGKYNTLVQYYYKIFPQKRGG